MKEKRLYSFEYLRYAPLEDLPEAERRLANCAAEACSKSYAPYSDFRVGAAALLDDGEIVSAANLSLGHVRRTQPALLRAVEPERTESPRAGNRLAARFAGMFALRSMPAGDRRHRKEAGRSDPADPVRRLQRDGRRVRARLVAFHVRARMNPMTSKKTTAAAEPVTRALSFSSRTAERERAVFCPAVLPKAVPATRIAPRTRDIAVFDRHGQKERRKRSASVCENPSGLAENGTGFGPAGRRKARFSRNNRPLMFEPERILYEDNHLIVVNKRSGELVQPDPTGDPALEDEVKEMIRVRDGKPGAVFLGIVHRIDRPVSGAVLFAKTSKALARMNETVKNRRIRKIYWAITENRPSPESGSLKHFLVRDGRTNRTKAYDRPVPDAKEARLDYRLLAESDRYRLLEIELLTGRHHQIRAQLSKIGCPIRGDLKYGAPRSNRDGSISLHARSIEFVHPVRRSPVLITAPVPPQDNLWKYFEQTAGQQQSSSIGGNGL